MSIKKIEIASTLDYQVDNKEIEYSRKPKHVVSCPSIKIEVEDGSMESFKFFNKYSKVLK